MDERAYEAASSMVGVPFTGTLGRGAGLSELYCPLLILMAQRSDIQRPAR